MAHAHTETMDTRKILRPVVKERPARGREMQTQDFAERDSIAGTMGGRAKTAPSEVFHEGYVGNKKYLVPDSNLEAMADMINLKMRRMESSKYVNERDMLRGTGGPEENYKKKKESLINKLNVLADDSDEETEETAEDDESVTTEEEETLKELTSSEEEVEKSAGAESESGEEEESEDEESTGKEPILLKGPTETKDLVQDNQAEELVPVYYHDPNIKRFLVSGHFRSNKKPIFIVQQYEGPSVFRNKDAEFCSLKTEQDVDIFACGEFYKESILEEDQYMRPVGLWTSPRKVVVDWRSRVYEEKFTDVFVGSDLDVELSGSFIRHLQRAHYTPMVSVMVRKGTAQEALSESKSGTTVYVMRPIVDNLFEREDKPRPQSRRSEDKKKTSVTFEEGVPRVRTGFQYPEGAAASGPMAVYVTNPIIRFPHRSDASGRPRTGGTGRSSTSTVATDAGRRSGRPSRTALPEGTRPPHGTDRQSRSTRPSETSVPESNRLQDGDNQFRSRRPSKTGLPEGTRPPHDAERMSRSRRPSEIALPGYNRPQDADGRSKRPSETGLQERTRPHDAERRSRSRRPSETSAPERNRLQDVERRSRSRRPSETTLPEHTRLHDAERRSRSRRPSETGDPAPGMRDTLLLPETAAAGEGLSDPEAAASRRSYIRRSLTEDESPAQALEAFVRTEREKWRGRRRKGRERVTMVTALSQLLFQE